MKSLDEAKVALVYDRVNKFGGAERVLLALHDLFPDAPLYTSVYNPETAPWANWMEVIPSYLQSISFIRTRHEWFAWAMPAVFESFNFDSYDIVISVTSAEAKGIITKPETLHISYLLTPTRYLWSHTGFYQNSKQATTKTWLLKKVTSVLLSNLRRWDYLAAQRPDKIIVISKTVAQRVQKYYQRKTDQVIYPPLSGLDKKPDKRIKPPKDYYLLVSRLVPYKRADLAIEACTQLNKHLVVVGKGSEYEKIRKNASKNVTMVGKLTESQLVSYYQGCRGLIFPAEEDFGLVSLEAQSFGKPVIAFAKGGASETVIHKKTGYLFKQQTVKSLVKALEQSELIDYNPEAIRAQAQKFNLDSFNNTFKKYVEAQWLKHQKMIG